MLRADDEGDAVQERGHLHGQGRLSLSRGTATAEALMDGRVTGVTITDPGSGYTSAPTVTLTGGGGTGAAVAVEFEGGGMDASENLFWARQALAGRQLVVEIADAESGGPPGEGGGS